jgi:hypothetical protein
VKEAFKLLASGKFTEGMSLLSNSDAWRDDSSLEAGRFYLGFPRTAGWGEGLLVASLLKRHAVACGTQVKVFAQRQVCEILRDDDAFDIEEVGSFEQCRSRGGRPPTALLKAALIGPLLDHAFMRIQVPSCSQAGGRRLGIAWASIDKRGTCIPEKSIPLSVFARILGKAVALPADVISFQREMSEETRGEFRGLFGAPPTEPRPDDLAKEIASLSCMLTISTTTAHIAACLGVPTILLAARRNGPQWFWRAQGDHGRCIYPTVRVILGGDGDDWWRTPGDIGVSQLHHRLRHPSLLCTEVSIAVTNNGNTCGPACAVHVGAQSIQRDGRSGREGQVCGAHGQVHRCRSGQWLLSRAGDPGAELPG